MPSLAATSHLVETIEDAAAEDHWKLVAPEKLFSYFQFRSRGWTFFNREAGRIQWGPQCRKPRKNRSLLGCGNDNSSADDSMLSSLPIMPARTVPAL